MGKHDIKKKKKGQQSSGLTLEEMVARRRSKSEKTEELAAPEDLFAQEKMPAVVDERFDEPLVVENATVGENEPAAEPPIKLGAHSKLPAGAAALGAADPLHSYIEPDVTPDSTAVIARVADETAELPKAQEVAEETLEESVAAEASDEPEVAEEPKAQEEPDEQVDDEAEETAALAAAHADEEADAAEDGFDPFAPQTLPEAPAAEVVPIAAAAGELATTQAGGIATPEQLEPPKKKRRGLKVSVAVAAAVVVLLGGSAIALAVDDSQRTQTVPPNTTLDGSIDLSGMTAEEVEQALETRNEAGYTKKLTLVVDNEEHEYDALSMSDVDIAGTVDAAFAPYHTNVLARWGGRIKELVTNEEPSYEVKTVFTTDEQRIGDAAQKIADAYNREVQEPGYSYNADEHKLNVNKPKNGIDVDVSATAANLTTAVADGFDDGEVVQVPATTTAPEGTELGQAIFVNLNECHLYFYDNGELIHNWPCSPGQYGYATPAGDWTLAYKDPSPSWYNPHAAWSEDMPDVIGPGYTNPLGLRALAVSCGNGIFIHGTTRTWALGYRDSHGCVRLSNDNIVTLYDEVNVGIPIYIH